MSRPRATFSSSPGSLMQKDISSNAVIHFKINSHTGTDHHQGVPMFAFLHMFIMCQVGAFLFLLRFSLGLEIRSVSHMLKETHKICSNFFDFYAWKKHFHSKRSPFLLRTELNLFFFFLWTAPSQFRSNFFFLSQKKAAANLLTSKSSFKPDSCIAQKWMRIALKLKNSSSQLEIQTIAFHWMLRQKEECFAFATANQQTSGFVIVGDITYSNQSVMVWSMSNFSVIPKSGKLGFSPLPTPTLVVITSKLTGVGWLNPYST